jgi:hypothetical protein
MTALSRVKGRSSSVWRVEDSNLSSFRDGFTDHYEGAAPSRLCSRMGADHLIERRSLTPPTR